MAFDHLPVRMLRIHPFDIHAEFTVPCDRQERKILGTGDVEGRWWRLGVCQKKRFPVLVFTKHETLGWDVKISAENGSYRTPSGNEPATMLGKSKSLGPRQFIGGQQLPEGIQLDGLQVEWQAPDMDLIVCELVLGRRVVPVERRLFHRCSIRPGEDCQDNGSESNKGTF